MSTISEIQVNTDELRSNAEILQEAEAELAGLLTDLQRSLSDIGSGQEYKDQLQGIVRGMISQVTSKSSNIQTELEKLINELRARAWAFDTANIPRGQKISTPIFGNYLLLALFSGLAGLEIGLANLVFNVAGFGNNFFSRLFSVIPAKPSSQTIRNLTNSQLDGKNDSTVVKNITSSSQEDLGALSRRYESNGNPGAVSSGAGDPGGVSYGAYQLTTGNVKRFLESENGEKWKNEFDGLQAGSIEFGNKWKEIASRDPNSFLQAQHNYIKRTHFDPVSAHLDTIGLDVNQRSAAIRDVTWSVSVQHGPGTRLIDNALAGKDISKLTDQEIIIAIYDERSRKNSDGNLVYFVNSSKNVQTGVENRFKNELQDALRMLGNR